jgi:hypothetical protein
VEVRNVGFRDPRFDNLEQFIPGIPYPTQPKLETRAPRYGETTTTQTDRKVQVVDEKGRDLTAAQTLAKLRDLPRESNLPTPDSTPPRGLPVTNQSSGEDR